MTEKRRAGNPDVFRKLHIRGKLLGGHTKERFLEVNPGNPPPALPAGTHGTRKKFFYKKYILNVWEYLSGYFTIRILPRVSAGLDRDVQATRQFKAKTR